MGEKSDSLFENLPEQGRSAQPTPMMAQYLRIKAEHENYLLFYRMGDFYELFMEDAKLAARSLDITLTHRGQYKGKKIPMCGVPAHAADGYLERLVRKGFKIAICEQKEGGVASKRGGKTLMAREVVRLVTPGTLTEDGLLDAKRNNFLAGFCVAKKEAALVWVDISTGEFYIRMGAVGALRQALSAVLPNEILLAEGSGELAGLEARLSESCTITELPASQFSAREGAGKMESLFGKAGIADASPLALSACGALLEYLHNTQKGKMPLLRPPRLQAESGIMHMDGATRNNLELHRTLQGGRQGSLLAHIDYSCTGAGARLLSAQLAAPLCDAGAINTRLEAVGYLAEHGELRRDLREVLARLTDMERALARLGLGRAGPRDVAAMGDGLYLASKIYGLLSRAKKLPALLGEVEEALSPLPIEKLMKHIRRAMGESLPLLARDGGIFRAGYHQALDELCAMRDEGVRLIAALQSRYAARTGVKSLKVKYNAVLGYYIEVSPAHGDRLMNDKDNVFVHRQTLGSAVRFTSIELSELADKIARAGESALILELELFETLCTEILEHCEHITSICASVASLDVAAALAELSEKQGWVRPYIDDSLAFSIKGGRHAVVEGALMKQGGANFIANDCHLNLPEKKQSLILLTGPNMAGKSTYLRQNALIAILAQMGSFVPAQSAHIGVIDRVFSRVGAADDLARGRSTFMVEMVETASILTQASKSSLIILDEIGRGTATFDGLSIAWAICEYLHENIRARTLFATHYHELTSLKEKLPLMANFTMRVKEWQGDIIFLHEVEEGESSHSYGIHVAALAGLPASIIERAGEILDRLEKGEVPSVMKGGGKKKNMPAASKLEGVLAGINPDSLSPREALEALYRLQKILAEKNE